MGLRLKMLFLLEGGSEKDRCRKALTRMIVLDELPFSYVEGEGFIDFCAEMNPRFKVPSKRTIVRDVIALYMHEKEKLTEYFKKSGQRVSLTTDTWTSIQNINYMVLTAHFIDENWHFHKKILNFVVIPDHRGETIGRLVEMSLREWDIECVYTVTVDNASANDTAITYLKRKLKDRNGFVLDDDFLHLRCCAHILNLIVSEGLKEKDRSIQAIRNAVRYVRSSPARLDKFKKAAALEKIDTTALMQFDVPTRWNSTYSMLSVALKFRKAFDRLKDDDSSYTFFFLGDDVGNSKIGPPDDGDWDNAEIFTAFLQRFYDMTFKFSVNVGVSADCYFHEMWNLQLDLLEKSNLSNNTLIQKMASEMKKKFDKYWGSLEKINSLLMVAVVLDPRYKDDYLGFCFEKLYDADIVEEMKKTVKSVLVRLYDWYKAADRHSNNSGDSSADDDNQPVSQAGATFTKANVRDEWKNKRKRIRDSKASSTFSKNEIYMYLLEELEDFECFDILQWWRKNCTKYRILARIARDVYAIPISTVASESAFSTGGRILDPYRSSLHPRIVQSLICTQNWLRSNKVYMPTETTVEELSMYDVIESEMYGRSSQSETTLLD